MRTIRDRFLTATAAIALVAAPAAIATVDASHAQGKSGESQGAAGEAGGGHGVASEAGGNPGGQGGTASSLGSLNATNASPQALENAAPNSVPGQLRTYRDALAIDDFEGAAGALSSAANKPLTIDEVREVNSRLGIVLTPEEEAALLQELD